MKDTLRAIADKYKSEGVNYAEMSITSFKPSELEQFITYLPDIEKETGVSLRFLASSVRRGDKDTMLDTADKIMSVAKCPYIVGCDFLGHEANKTNDFKEPLQKLAQYAMENDPSFCIRVHAGENENHKENVADVFKAIKEIKETMERESGKTFQYPEVRIGHGLYGLDEETIKLCKEVGATIEINASSNYSLNNINSYGDLPVKKYLDAGINIVYGSDGTGMYNTNAKNEVSHALKAGATIDDIQRTVEYESKLKEKKMKVFEQKGQALVEQIELPENQGLDFAGVMDKIYKPEFSTIDGRARSNSQNAKESRKAGQEKQNKQYEKLGAQVEFIENGIEGKTPIYLAGLENAEFSKLNEEQQHEIRTQVSVLAKSIDPQKAYFVIPPSPPSRMAKHIKDVADADTQILSYLPTSALRNVLDDNYVPNFTHAIKAKNELGESARDDYTMITHVISDLAKNNGTAIFIGGTGATKDYIQMCANKNCPTFLSSISGASKEKGKALANPNMSRFCDTQDLIKQFHERNNGVFKDGFDIAQLSQIIAQEQQKMQINDLQNTKNSVQYNMPLQMEGGIK